MNNQDIYIRLVPYDYPGRYNTVGDWYFKNGKWIIEIANTGKWKYNILIAIHELIEMIDCRAHGIPEEEVLKFDIDSDLDNPGVSKKAPYYKEHIFAEAIEKQVAKEIGVDWEEYNKEF